MEDIESDSTRIDFPCLVGDRQPGFLSSTDLTEDIRVSVLRDLGEGEYPLLHDRERCPSGECFLNGDKERFLPGDFDNRREYGEREILLRGDDEPCLCAEVERLELNDGESLEEHLGLSDGESLLEDCLGLSDG
jgi:hypothetical protein